MPTFEELVETLMDEKASSYSRRSAISGLVRLGDELAVQPLVSALQDEDQYIRREAAMALGDLGFSAAIEPLIEALKDSEDNVRRNAITALGAIGDERAVEPLKQLLQDQSFFTRSEAERSIRKIEERLAEPKPAEKPIPEAPPPPVKPEVEEVQPAPEVEIIPVDVPEEVPIVEPVVEAIEPVELPVEEKPSPRKLTDAEEKYIQEQVKTGAKAVIMIIFDRVQTHPFFRPGEVMRGRVLLRAAKPIKARGVYLSVEGKEKVRWTEGSGNNSRTYKDEHVIIDRNLLLSAGQQVIPPGNYEYLFECRIPENSPPPYKSKVCTCEYSISAYVDVPAKRDVKCEQDFYVSAPPRDMEKQVDNISSSARSSSQEITLLLHLEDNACPIGSLVKGTVSFQNHSRRKIRGIDVELLHHEYARCRGKSGLFSSKDRMKETTYKTNVIRIPLPEEDLYEFQTGFSLRVPNSAQEAGLWTLFHVSASVKVSLDVAWANDVNCSHTIDMLPASERV